jgi:alkylated DNA repair dioxygenase AlkB
MTPALHQDPTFVASPAALFDELLRTVDWDDRMRARRTASFGVAYDYSGLRYVERPMRADLASIAESIERTLGFSPNNCLLNLYPDGDSSMGFHSDSSAELAPGTGVAIVSLGASRTIVFRNKADRAVERAYRLEAGALLYMTDAVQTEWLHAIPREAGAGPRISLTFRRIVSGSPSK